MMQALAIDYRAVFEASRHPYLLLSTELGILDANRAYLDATMTERDALLGRHIFDAFPDNPADPTADGTRNLGASLERVLATGLPDAMPIQKYDIRAADGAFAERWWDPLNMPVMVDGDHITAILHHVIDVTHRVLWRPPYQRRRRTEPLRLEELTGLLAATASDLEETDRTVKETQNRLFRSRRLIEESCQSIAASRHQLESARKQGK